MTYPPYMRKKARQMRREKELTIDEIAERLAIGRTTAYLWVHDMPRPKRCLQRPGPAHYIGSTANQRMHKRLRQEAYTLGRWEFSRLEAEPTFRDFVALYIAEGYKRNRNVVSICNSDTPVMKVSTLWMRRFSRRPLSFWI